jgi:hypothetical protein
MQAFSRDVISAFSQTRVIFHVPHLGYFGMLCTSSHNDRNASRVWHRHPAAESATSATAACTCSAASTTGGVTRGFVTVTLLP